MQGAKCAQVLDNFSNKGMDCKETGLSSSLSSINFPAPVSWCKGPLFARCAHSIVPMCSIASFDVKPQIPPTRNSRILPSMMENAPLEAGRKFTRNADHDLRSMCEEGQPKEAVAYLELLHKGSLHLEPKTYAFLLQECAKAQALEEGKKIHGLLVTSGVKVDITVRNNLLSMYVKCGNLKEARLLFEAMGTSRDVVSWTLMINACAQYGQFKEAFKLYFTMLNRKMKPNKITFVVLLKACTRLRALVNGQLLHEHIINRRLQGDKYVGGALVEMYFNCGRVKCAREAFYEIIEKTSFLWNLLVVGYVENDRSMEALKVVRHMRYRHCVEPSETSWAYILKACGDLEELKEGRLFHDLISIRGIDLGGHIGQELVYMYVSCGCLEDARHVFEQLQSRPLSLWELVIAVYSDYGEHEEASKLTIQMQTEATTTESTVEEKESLDLLDCV